MVIGARNMIISVISALNLADCAEMAEKECFLCCVFSSRAFTSTRKLNTCKQNNKQLTIIFNFH